MIRKLKSIWSAYWAMVVVKDEEFEQFMREW